jgi:hypothetical protein
MNPVFAGAFALPCAGAARYLLNEDGWRAMAAAQDLRFIAMWADEASVIALMRDGAGGRVMGTVAVEHGFFPGLSPWRAEAAVFERMIRDLWGYNPVGGTDGRPLFDFGQWRLANPLGRPIAPFAAPEPATSGFAHKGTLALMRGKAPRVAARFAARVDGAATVAHGIAFARAAEAAARVPAPPRAERLRQVMARLEAIGGALDSIARLAAAAAAVVLEGQALVLREAVARTAASAFGHRLMMDCVVPGGVVVDASADAPGALLWLRRSVTEAGLPDLVAASLGPRLRDMPLVAARADAACAAIAAGLDDLGVLIEGLAEGPVIQANLAMAGEGIGVAEGPLGEILYWLRLEGGQIGGAFVLDPAWALAPACAAEAGAAAAEDRALVLASYGILASGMEL